MRQLALVASIWNLRQQDFAKGTFLTPHFSHFWPKSDLACDSNKLKVFFHAPYVFSTGSHMMQCTSQLRPPALTSCPAWLRMADSFPSVYQQMRDSVCLFAFPILRPFRVNEFSPSKVLHTRTRSEGILLDSDRLAHLQFIIFLTRLHNSSSTGALSF